MALINEEKLKIEVGKLITARRKAVGISQEELAEKLGIKVRTLSKLENGHAFISARTLCKLCEFFELSPKAFFDFEMTKNTDIRKLNDIIEKLSLCDSENISFYYNLINLIDKKYNG